MRCLFCYQKSENDYHNKCLELFFGSNKSPLINYTLNDLNDLAKKIIKSRIVIPGVQPKLSLHIEKGNTQRLTIVGLEGDFILKPPTNEFPNLPENEDLTMHLAEICGIKVVPHTLVKLKSGEYAYLTRRIDRINGQKIHMEDMCQILGNLTENKYNSSMEKIGKAILKYSKLKGLDLISFFEMTLFSYLVGNSDMHLKNFSLIESDNGFVLSPAYDLVSVKLAMPKDNEELALTLNGKKNNLEKKDFLKFGETINLQEKTILNIFENFKSKLPILTEYINISFLNDDLKKRYIDLLNKRFNTLFK
jgi:serine/threonine-protein kinase HipA